MGKPSTKSKKKNVPSTTTIKIKISTQNRLRKHGKMGQTFDSLLNEICDKIEKR